MTSNDRKIRVAEFFSLMGDADLRQKALDMMSDDATWWMPGAGSCDKSQLAAKLARADKVFKGPIDVTVTGIVAEGDAVAVETIGDVDVIDGSRYHNYYHCVVRFSGDKISEVREYCDTKYAAGVLGALMAAS